MIAKVQKKQPQKPNALATSHRTKAVHLAVNALHVHHALHAAAVAKVNLRLMKYDVRAISHKTKVAHLAVAQPAHHAANALHAKAKILQRQLMK